MTLIFLSNTFHGWHFHFPFLVYSDKFSIMFENSIQIRHPWQLRFIQSCWGKGTSLWSTVEGGHVLQKFHSVKVSDVSTRLYLAFCRKSFVSFSLKSCIVLSDFRSTSTLVRNMRARVCSRSLYLRSFQTCNLPFGCQIVISHYAGLTTLHGPLVWHLQSCRI